MLREKMWCSRFYMRKIRLFYVVWKIIINVLFLCTEYVETICSKCVRIITIYTCTCRPRIRIQVGITTIRWIRSAFPRRVAHTINLAVTSLKRHTLRCGQRFGSSITILKHDRKWIHINIVFYEQIKKTLKILVCEMPIYILQL